MSKMLKYVICIYIFVIIPSLVFGQTPLVSTKVNEALKRQLNSEGKWVVVEMADGTSFSTAPVGGGDVVGGSASSDGEVPFYSGAGGKTLKRSNNFSGVLKLTAGVAGTNTTTADVPDSTDKRYVTDANLVVVGNTSGVNTGDNAANSSTTHVGTTAIALNRASTAQALTGISSIDGTAGGLAGDPAISVSSIANSGNYTQSGIALNSFTGNILGNKFFQSPYRVIAPTKIINKGTGVLSSIATAIASGTNPNGVSVDPTGRFVYVANSGTSTVSQYSINQSTGALSSIATAIASGATPREVSVDPTGRFVYVANYGDSTVSQYSINQSTGALSSIATAIASGTNPWGVSVDPTGRFVYVSNYTDSTVSQYSINQSTGALSSIATAIASGTNPRVVSTDSTGRFVYVVNQGASTVSQYSINQSTGALSSIATAIASGATPQGVSVDPTGRFVYVANYTASTVSQYSINQSTGALSSIATAIASGANAWGVSVDPTGRFVYVSNYTDSTVSQYSINQTTGALASIATAIASGANPREVSVDPTGRFVYVANYGDSTVSQYSINNFSAGNGSFAKTLSVATPSGVYGLNIGGSLGIIGSYTDSSNYYALKVLMESGGTTFSVDELGTGIGNRDITLTPSGTGKVILSAIPRFNGSQTTGTGTALLGANCPAITVSAPYTWITVITSDGSTGYIPIYK